MSDQEPLEQSEMSEAVALALASAAARDRDVWRAFFALDARLARAVARAREPALAQIRLAWWRDELGKGLDERSCGDPVLAAIGANWVGHERALVELVDSWELLLADEPDEIGFAKGRGAACGGLARRLDHADAVNACQTAGVTWALAETIARHDDPGDFATALDRARAILPPRARLPRRLRPLAVLDGLARRAMARGGGPLIGDRFSPLVALRLGMFGR